MSIFCFYPLLLHSLCFFCSEKTPAALLRSHRRSECPQDAGGDCCDLVLGNIGAVDRLQTASFAVFKRVVAAPFVRARSRSGRRYGGAFDEFHIQHAHFCRGVSALYLTLQNFNGERCLLFQILPNGCQWRIDLSADGDVVKPYNRCLLYTSARMAPKSASRPRKRYLQSTKPLIALV